MHSMKVNGTQRGPSRPPSSPAASWWNNLGMTARLRLLPKIPVDQDVPLMLIGLDWSELPGWLQQPLEQFRSNQLLRRGKREGRIIE